MSRNNFLGIHKFQIFAHYCSSYLTAVKSRTEVCNFLDFMDSAKYFLKEMAFRRYIHQQRSTFSLFMLTTNKRRQLEFLNTILLFSLHFVVTILWYIMPTNTICGHFPVCHTNLAFFGYPCTTLIHTYYIRIFYIVFISIGNRP